MAVLSKEIAAYERMRETLEAESFGMWVVVYEERLVGRYASFENAAESAVQRFGRGAYLIRQVGAPPPTFPASLLHRPVFAND